MDNITVLTLANKMPKRRKIVFIGDSITAGDATSLRCYPVLFQAMTGWLHTVLNKGVSGNMTADLLSRFTTDVLNNKPDYCVINIGKNDITNSVAMATIKLNITEMVKILTSNGIIPVLSTVIPYGTGFSQTLRDNTTLLNAWIREFATRNSICCIDFYNALVSDVAGVVKAEYILQDDQLHPTKYGMMILAGLFQPIFDTKMIKRVPVPRGTNLVVNPQFDDTDSDGIPNNFALNKDGAVTMTGEIQSVVGLGKQLKLNFSAATSSGMYGFLTQQITGWAVGNTLEVSIDVCLTDYATDATIDSGFSVRLRETATTYFECYPIAYWTTPFGKVIRLKNRIVVPAGSTVLFLEIGFINATKGTVYVSRPSINVV